MHILLNGEPHELPENATLGELLATLDLKNQRYATEVNEELVPRSQQATHGLHANDRVEIVHAIGGG